MITKHDILDAISECQGARNPGAKVIELLAALYIVKDHMDKDEPAVQQQYSFAPAPRQDVVRYMGHTPFARAIYGRQADDIWLLMDDLMTAVKTQNPRLYDSIMRQL